VEYTLTLNLSHVTEVGAIAAARSAGFGNKTIWKLVLEIKKYRSWVNLSSMKG